MGVFAMFRRKGKEAAEASTEEAQAVAVTDAPEEAEPGARSGEAVDAETKDGTGAASTAEPSDVSEPGEGEGVVEAEVVEAVEIPKQQSADEAADNEAGESARK